MFDSSKEFEVKIVSAGVKSCVLTFPTDAQWCDRARRQKTVKHFLGRGKVKTTDANTDAVDSRLFESLRVNKNGNSDGVFDAAEAAAFIERLERAEVTSAAWQGDNRRIEMRVPGARVVHVLRIPTKAEAREHERGSTDQTYAARTAELFISLEPSGVLYDKLVDRDKLEGYANPSAVPIVHKVAAVSDLLGSLSELLAEESDDPEQ